MNYVTLAVFFLLSFASYATPQSTAETNDHESLYTATCGFILKGELPLKEVFYGTIWENTEMGAKVSIEASGKYLVEDPGGRFKRYQGNQIAVLTYQFFNIENGTEQPFLYLPFSFANGIFLHISCKESTVALCNGFCLTPKI